MDIGLYEQEYLEIKAEGIKFLKRVALGVIRYSQNDTRRWTSLVIRASSSVILSAGLYGPGVPASVGPSASRRTVDLS